MMRDNHRPRLACHVVAWIALAVTGLAGASPPVGEKHIYKTAGGINLALYVTKPNDWQPTDHRAAIVFFHGGSWTKGKPGQFTEHSKYLASRGMVAVQAQYRLLDKKTNDPPIVCLYDAKSAMRWVRIHANELGINPDRIASAGGSAGGHLAAHIGIVNGGDDPSDDLTVPSHSNAMVLFNPVFDNGPDGWGHKRIRERYPEFSPMHNISHDAPPAILFFGTEDVATPVATVDAFRLKMHEDGVRCEVILFPGKKHGFFNHGKHDNEPFYQTLLATDVFLTSLGWLDGLPTLKAPTEAPLNE